MKKRVREVRLRIEPVLRELEPAELELRLERLLGVLLLVEIDRQLDVLTVDRRNALDLTNDLTRLVDLIGHVAGRAVQLLLHRELDPELADTFVQFVPLLEVHVLGLGGDAPHVAHDVTGQRRVRIHPSRFFHHHDAGEILDPFENRGGRRLVDVLGHRHRQEVAVDLCVVAFLHLLDRHIEPARQTTEDLGAPVGTR